MVNAAREEWCQRMLSGVDLPVPRFGSPEWLALPEDDRRKVAGVVIAAACWAREGDELEDRIRAEVAALQRAYRAGEDQNRLDRIADWQERWTGRGFKRDRWTESRIEAEYVEWIGGETS